MLPRFPYQHGWRGRLRSIGSRESRRMGDAKSREVPHEASSSTSPGPPEHLVAPRDRRGRHRPRGRRVCGSRPHAVARQVHRVRFDGRHTVRGHPGHARGHHRPSVPARRDLGVRVDLGIERAGGHGDADRSGDRRDPGHRQRSGPGVRAVRRRWGDLRHELPGQQPHPYRPGDEPGDEDDLARVGRQRSGGCRRSRRGRVGRRA